MHLQKFMPSLTPCFRLLVCLAAMLAALQQAPQSKAEQVRPSEDMLAALQTCRSCTAESSRCDNYNQSPFSLSLRDVYVPPKTWRRLVRAPLALDRAMEMAFGNYDRGRGVSLHWLESHDDGKGWTFRQGWACAAALLFTPVVEKGRLTYWLATTSCSEAVTGTCHACSAILSVMVFEETARGWRIVARNKQPIRMGEYGAADRVVPVRIGPVRVGLWVQECGMAQGYVGGRASLLSRLKNQVVIVFNGRVVDDSTGTPFIASPKRTTCSYWFLRGTGREFDDLQAMVTTISWGKGGKNVRTTVKRLRYADGAFPCIPFGTH